jgi:hypothetical protein
VIALFYDVTVLHHQDQIRVFDGGKTVCYDEACPARSHLTESTLYAVFCARVYGAGGLIQYQDGRDGYHDTADT